MRHINIPVFIPHLGCPNLCVFCNQRTISGTCDFREENVKTIIEETLSTAGDAEAEIAFFGGSFTGIDRALMIRLLDTAQSYADSGRVIGIRMSTRPDYIDKEIISILKNYAVTQVELGIQSMSEKVLSVSKRGHTAEDSRKACAMLCEAGFETVGQMMVGLPGATVEDEMLTAEEICKMKCRGSRIYPTIVFKDTELEKMYIDGCYSPLSVDEAVERSSEVLGVFEKNGVTCLRIGLCESDNLHSDDTYSAGPNHSAIGELVMSRLFYNRIREEISGRVNGSEGIPKSVVIECPEGCVSKVSGNCKENKKKIYSEFGIKNIKIVENPFLLGYNIRVLFI